MGQERVVVSSVAGTTRDSIDTPLTYNGKNYVIIDTAGIRRKSKIDDESVERYSVIRAFDSIRRADVVLVMFDAEQGLSEQDTKIIGFVHEENKPSIVVVNKWDIIEKDDKTINYFNSRIQTDLAFMNYLKTIFISAKTGQRVNKIMDMVDEVYANANKRISTGLLNEIIQTDISIKETPASIIL